MCVSMFASDSAEANHSKPAEDLSQCLDINPQEAFNSPPKEPPGRACIKAMAKQNG